MSPHIYLESTDVEIGKPPALHTLQCVVDTPRTQFAVITPIVNLSPDMFQMLGLPGNGLRRDGNELWDQQCVESYSMRTTRLAHGRQVGKRGDGHFVRKEKER